MLNNIRLLKADEIECKVSTINEKGCSLLLYKTARTDMDLLDETFGAMNWDCDYKEIKGNMYCGISVYNEKADKWVTKWDCGVESAFGDKEKGEASDAFKRAGFKWGIGRELYTSPFIWVASEKCNIYKTNRTDKNGKPIYACNDKFAVKTINYNANREICGLTIVNLNTNKVVFAFGKCEPDAQKAAEEDVKLSITTETNIKKLINQYATMKNGDANELTKYYLKKLDVASLSELTNEQGKLIVSELIKLIDRRVA